MGTDINKQPSRGDNHGIGINAISGGVSAWVCELVNVRLSGNQDVWGLTVAKTFKRKEIDQLVKNISVVGDSEQQISKIQLLLILAKDADIGKAEREWYFYQAVDIAKQYFWKSYLDNRHWKPIVDIYRGYIASNVDISIRKSMMYDNNERRQREIMTAKNTQTYLSGITDPDKILAKLESLIGSVRLIITSENSGEVVVRHNINQSDIQTTEYIPISRYRTEVNIFDRKNWYVIAIDHGSNETNNQINESDWNDYIKPIIDIYIEQLESALFHQKYENIVSIRSIEKQRKKPQEHYEYGAFLESLIASQLVPWTHESREKYIDNLRKAIDISRLITLSHSGNRYIKKVDLAQAIDHILGWRITRRIYDLVKSIILSRDETMDGLGYPSGLSKADIPIEARIYSIIRSYEALATPDDLQEARIMLEKWKNSGHLDSTILEIFLKSLEEGKISKSKTNTQWAVTPYRRGSYEIQIDL